MKKYISLPIFLLMLLSGCQKLDIETYADMGSLNYLSFVKPLTDSVTFSFTHHLGKDEFDFPVPIEMSGKAYAEDKEYRIVIDSSRSSAGVNVRMPENPVFRAGRVKDTCWVRIIKTEVLDTVEMRLVLHVRENNTFQVGQLNFLYNIIRINNQISEPDWWWYDDNIYQSPGMLLGVYSNIKFSHFITATGITDMTDMGYEEQRYWVLIFKNYLRQKDAEGETVYEEDGVTKVLATIYLVG